MATFFASGISRHRIWCPLLADECLKWGRKRNGRFGWPHHGKRPFRRSLADGSSRAGSGMAGVCGSQRAADICMPMCAGHLRAEGRALIFCARQKGSLPWASGATRRTLFAQPCHAARPTATMRYHPGTAKIERRLLRARPTSDIGWSELRVSARRSCYLHRA